MKGSPRTPRTEDPSRAKQFMHFVRIFHRHLWWWKPALERSCSFSMMANTAYTHCIL